MTFTQVSFNQRNEVNNRMKWIGALALILALAGAVRFHDLARSAVRSDEIAFLFRAQEVKMPELGADALLTPELRSWKTRIEALPYLASTIPPHWQKKG